MKNIFEQTDLNLRKAFMTDLAITYVVISQKAMNDVLWAEKMLKEDSSDTFAKTTFTEAVGTMEAATAMLLSSIGYKAKGGNNYSFSRKVVKIRLRRYGINLYDIKYRF